jgi:hypothetical protein
MYAGGLKQVQYKEYICWMQGKIYISDQTSMRICNSVDRRHTRRLRKRDNLLTREREGVGRGADSCDRKKVWSSINHSILSVLCSAEKEKKHSAQDTVLYRNGRYFEFLIIVSESLNNRRLFDISTRHC